jgi:hypothetical protein
MQIPNRLKELDNKVRDNRDRARQDVDLFYVFYLNV